MDWWTPAVGRLAVTTHPKATEVVTARRARAFCGWAGAVWSPSIRQKQEEGSLVGFDSQRPHLEFIQSAGSPLHRPVGPLLSGTVLAIPSSRQLPGKGFSSITEGPSIVADSAISFHLRSSGLQQLHSRNDKRVLCRRIGWTCLSQNSLSSI